MQVPHSLILFKFSYLGVLPSILRQIEKYLSFESGLYVVTSGVPHGSVLELLLFLIYLNDTGTNITSHIRLYTDDCVIYRNIST